VRHPLDSWISLQAQNWHKLFRFPSLAEFCRRGLQMLDACAGQPLLRYEDFTLQPQEGLKQISQVLALPAPTNSSEHLPANTLSGNSGRSGDAIGPRPRRRPVPIAVLDELEAECTSSSWHRSPYQTLCRQLGYSPDPTAEHPFTATATIPTDRKLLLAP
jgi:hypothetical protein